MADNLNTLNTRRRVYNKLIIIAVIVTILTVPGYVGLAIGFRLYYGEAYFNAIYDPNYLFEQYRN